MEPRIHSQFALLGQRRFLPFFITQFLGAFNDNVFKNALIIMIAFRSTSYTTVPTDVLTNLSQGLFILPFLLFSATAGQLIEKYEKSSSMRRIKLLEITIMLCAAVAFHVGSLYALIALLFLMGTQSSLFGPAKYSYIPEHVHTRELVGANGLVQTGTFIAILVGTMCGGILIGIDGGERYVAATVVCLAVAGFVASLAIPLTPSANSELVLNRNPFAETWNNIGIVTREKDVMYAVLGISWFWFLGASYLVQLPNYTRTVLGGNEQVVTLLLTLFTIGIGTGSLLCNRIMRGKVGLGLVPVGIAGLTLFGIDLYFSAGDAPAGTALIGLERFLADGNLRTIFDVLLIGIAGGLYIVPLFSFIQHRVPARKLSRVVAGNNIFNALYMVCSALLAMLLLGNGIGIPTLFLLVSVLNLLHGFIILRKISA